MAICIRRLTNCPRDAFPQQLRALAPVHTEEVRIILSRSVWPMMGAPCNTRRSRSARRAGLVSIQAGRLLVVWPLSLEPGRSSCASMVSPETCHADQLLTTDGREGAPPPTVVGHHQSRGRGETPRRRGGVAQPRRSAHAHTALSVHGHRPHDRAPGVVPRMAAWFNRAAMRRRGRRVMAPPAAVGTHHDGYPPSRTGDLLARGAGDAGADSPAALCRLPA